MTSPTSLYLPNYYVTWFRGHWVTTFENFDFTSWLCFTTV